MTDRIKKILETVYEENKTSEWYKDSKDKNMAGLYVFVDAGCGSSAISDWSFDIVKDGKGSNPVLSISYDDFLMLNEGGFLYPDSYGGYKPRKCFDFRLDKVEQALKEYTE